MKKYISFLAGKVEFEFFIYTGLVAIFFNIIYCLLGTYIDYSGALYLGIGSLIMFACLHLYRKGYKRTARMVSALCFNGMIIAISLHLGSASGASLYYFPYLISFFHIFREEGSPRTAYFYMGFSFMILLGIALFCPLYADQQIMPRKSVDLIAYFSFFLTVVYTALYFAVIYQYQINLRERLMQFERKKNRKTLEAFFMEQEKEKEALVHELRNNINQGLVSSKMFLELAKDNARDNAFLQKGYELTLATINDMDDLCDLLDPAIIREVGLREGLEEYIQLFQANTAIEVELQMKNDRIEEIPLAHKLSIFRIIQHYLNILSKNPEGGTALVELDFQYPDLKMVLGFRQPEKEFPKPIPSEAFTQWRSRVEHFGGSLVEQANTGQFRVNIGMRMA